MAKRSKKAAARKGVRKKARKKALRKFRKVARKAAARKAVRRKPVRKRTASPIETVEAAASQVIDKVGKAVSDFVAYASPHGKGGGVND